MYNESNILDTFVPHNAGIQSMQELIEEEAALRRKLRKKKKKLKKAKKNGKGY